MSSIYSNDNEENGSMEAGKQPACAACRHQRKSCKRGCILGPYFPADRSKEFQAVHRVFGVSNLTKLIGSINEADRKTASESFIWEANYRLQEPVLGTRGEYLKVCEKLEIYKKRCEELTMVVQSLRMPTPLRDVIRWSGTNGMGNGIMDSNNNALSYNDDVNILTGGLSSYGFHSPLVPIPDVVGPIVVPYQQPQQQQQHYLPYQQPQQQTNPS